MPYFQATIPPGSVFQLYNLQDTPVSSDDEMHRLMPGLIVAEVVRYIGSCTGTSACCLMQDNCKIATWKSGECVGMVATMSVDTALACSPGYPKFTAHGSPVPATPCALISYRTDPPASPERVNSALPAVAVSIIVTSIPVM